MPKLNLEKDQEVKLNDQFLIQDRLYVGLGWKPTASMLAKIKSGKNFDFDAWAIAIGEDGKGVDVCYFGQKSSLNGTLSLSGDDLTGADDGEGASAPDEVITVDLNALELWNQKNPTKKIGKLLFVINSYSGQTFGDCEEVFCDVSDQPLLGPGAMPAVLGVDLDAEFDKATCASVAALTYDGSSWVLKAIKTPLSGIKPLLQSFGFSM